MAVRDPFLVSIEISLLNLMSISVSILLRECSLFIGRGGPVPGENVGSIFFTLPPADVQIFLTLQPSMGKKNDPPCRDL